MYPNDRNGRLDKYVQYLMKPNMTLIKFSKINSKFGLYM